MLYPDIAVSSVYDIDMAELRGRGVKGLILDIDNTLARPDARMPDKRAVDWLRYAEGAGFRICLLSNSVERRASRFALAFASTVIPHARKPMKKGFLNAMRNMGVEPSQACVIGDQIFTDVYGAKRLGILSVYTKRITNREGLLVKMKRLPEYFVLKRYERTGGGRFY